LFTASDFVDPLFYDTRLTKKGAEQAASLAPVTRFLNPAPEVLIASPLHRAMTTADLAFDSCKGEFILIFVWAIGMTACFFKALKKRRAR
tara:strand:+ start:658 stop:927 length:270 start_codon:yes stop_codon:yes gene_type:complete